MGQFLTMPEANENPPMPTSPPATEGRRMAPLTFSHLHGVGVSERLLALSLLGDLDSEAWPGDSGVVYVEGSP